MLRGDPSAGMSASQGSLPSTLWGERALNLMLQDHSAADAVVATVADDDGRDMRQLAVLDRLGRTACHTGAQSVAYAGSRSDHHVIVSGNLLQSEAVVDACMAGFTRAAGSLDQRLIAALYAAAEAGGDSRGLLSAALLVVSPAAAPLNLRVDYADDPVDALAALHGRATTGDYAKWAAKVPTARSPHLSEL